MTSAPGVARPESPATAEHRALHAIALFEACKGLAAALAAAGLEVLGPTSLQRGLAVLGGHFQRDPNRGALAWLTRGVDADAVHLIAAVAGSYALMRFVEAWGLWRHRAWASWFGCIGAAAYLPFDLYALFAHPGWLSVAVLAINLLVVWVLARDLLQRRRRAAYAY